MRITKITLVAACALALVGCGDTFGERSVIGAGAGAGTAALLGGNVAVGGLVGAAANVAYCDRYPTRC